MVGLGVLPRSSRCTLADGCTLSMTRSVSRAMRSVMKLTLIDSRDVVKEPDERERARCGEDHCPERRERRHGRPCGVRHRKKREAIEERPEEDADRMLIDAVLNERGQNARRELSGDDRQGDEQHGEDDRDDGHDRTRDGAEHHLSDLRIRSAKETKPRGPRR